MIPQELRKMLDHDELAVLIEGDMPKSKMELISKFRALDDSTINQIAVGLLVAAMFDIADNENANTDELRGMADMALRMTNKICDMAGNED